jgi:hypothetical protein
MVEHVVDLLANVLENPSTLLSVPNHPPHTIDKVEKL